MHSSELLPGGHFRPQNCTARQRVAIIIPYRQRENHLKVFLHNMHPMLQRQQADYTIFVIEQVGFKYNEEIDCQTAVFSCNFVRFVPIERSTVIPGSIVPSFLMSDLLKRSNCTSLIVLFFMTWI